MVLAALAKNEVELKVAQYKVCREWQETYNGILLVFLPDTFGTTQFLKNAPEWLNYWAGARPDSKKALPTEGTALTGGDELINFWNGRGLDAREKLIIFADGLDVKLPGHTAQGEDICEIYDYYNGRVKIGFGFGTMFTNDFLDCHPMAPNEMKPLSLVCKVEFVEYNGIHRETVKLSDNFTKATTGSDAELERYRAAFGFEGMENAPVMV